MKTKMFTFFYLFLVIITLFLAYDYYPSIKHTGQTKAVLTPRLDLFENYKEKFDTNKSLAYIWGLEEEEIQQQTRQLDKDNNVTKESLVIKQNGSSLCVGVDCFRFLGVFTKQNHSYVALYNKNYKHGINNFTIGDIIGYTLFVKNIAHNNVIIKDKNLSKEWKFQLFDVNATQYRPKDINETNL